MSCLVPGCGSHSSRRQNNDVQISYHRFPKNSTIKKKWLEAINKADDWIPNNDRRICSKHFTPACFVQSMTDLKWRRLEPDAVPSLLLPQIQESSHQSSQQVKVEESENFPMDVPLESELEDIKSINPVDIESIKVETGCTKQPKIEQCDALPTAALHIEIKRLVMELELVKAELARTKKSLSKITKVSEQRLKKINALKQKTRRLRVKNVDYNSVLDQLLNKENI